ncbi:MAG: Na(+)-translocating NADH-quinone reductase subunit A [Candidatus Marinimicrobia bacterium]|nr:Na(+)-translocating NADH-quinone reductase subunit A [Candidatus Neomarinimicrobiota bacterium]MBL7059825.1 Na(+)-translocating NADH-quinone reductase subunit A [Candidatus Neomarinimicrobiota bacterium]
MSDIRLKKGHDIRIAGVPSKELVSGTSSTSIALIPIEFPSVKPKLLVKEGDAVTIGTPLFFDKVHPEIKFASPGGGTIQKIQFGARRKIERIIIALDKEESALTTEIFTNNSLVSLGKEKVIETILSANLWHLIRQRPFNKIACPEDNPKAIFVSGLNTAPLSVDLELALKGKEKEFQSGLDVLTNLTDGKTHLTLPKSSILAGMKNVDIHTISGAHPAGNVGIQIHHIDPINPHEVVWTVSAQHVVTIGKLFLSGVYDPSIVVSVGGPSVTSPEHISTRVGAPFTGLLENRIEEGKHRIIHGDVLTGQKASMRYYLGSYDTTLSVIPISYERPVLGWIRPGTSKNAYSLTKTFLSFGKSLFNFSTLQNGAERGLVPFEVWEDMLPMDILPNPLYRSILAKDVEEMEKLGIYECDPEDFALCSFACPSKIDVGNAIKQGLELMEKEG